MDSLFNTPADQPNERDELISKWKDKPVEELLKAKVESDLYIKTLERQKDELRNDYLKAHEDLQARANLQELIDKMNSLQTTPAPVTPQGSAEKPADPIDFEKLIDQRYEQKKIAEKEAENYRIVSQKLQERFGGNTATVLKEQAQALGLSEDEVNTMARKSPEAFFRLMGLTQQPQENFMTPPRNDVRNDHFTPHQPKRTWSYYENMKKTDPKTYWDPKTQLQMHKDADKLGIAFEDGSFNAYGPNY